MHKVCSMGLHPYNEFMPSRIYLANICTHSLYSTALFVQKDIDANEYVQQSSANAYSDYDDNNNWN